MCAMSSSDLIKGSSEHAPAADRNSGFVQATYKTLCIAHATLTDGLLMVVHTHQRSHSSLLNCLLLIIKMESKINLVTVVRDFI